MIILLNIYLYNIPDSFTSLIGTVIVNGETSFELDLLLVVKGKFDNFKYLEPFPLKAFFSKLRKELRSGLHCPLTSFSGIHGYNVKRSI